MVVPETETYRIQKRRSASIAAPEPEPDHSEALAAAAAATFSGFSVAAEPEVVASESVTTILKTIASRPPFSVYSIASSPRSFPRSLANFRKKTKQRLQDSISPSPREGLFAACILAPPVIADTSWLPSVISRITSYALIGTDNAATIRRKLTTRHPFETKWSEYWVDEKLFAGRNSRQRRPPTSRLHPAAAAAECHRTSTWATCSTTPRWTSSSAGSA